MKAKFHGESRRKSRRESERARKQSREHGNSQVGTETVERARKQPTEDMRQKYMSLVKIWRAEQALHSEVMPEESSSRVRGQQKKTRLPMESRLWPRNSHVERSTEQRGSSVSKDWRYRRCRLKYTFTPVLTVFRFSTGCQCSPYVSMIWLRRIILVLVIAIWPQMLCRCDSCWLSLLHELQDRL